MQPYQGGAQWYPTGGAQSYAGGYQQQQQQVAYSSYQPQPQQTAYDAARSQAQALYHMSHGEHSSSLRIQEARDRRTQIGASSSYRRSASPNVELTLGGPSAAQSAPVTHSFFPQETGLSRRRSFSHSRSPSVVETQGFGGPPVDNTGRRLSRERSGERRLNLTLGQSRLDFI